MRWNLFLWALCGASVATFACSRAEDTSSHDEAATEAHVTREWATRLKTNFTAVTTASNPMLRAARKVTNFERQSPDSNRELSSRAASMLSNVDQAIASLRLVAEDEVSWNRGVPLTISRGEPADTLESRTAWGALNGATALRAILTGELAEGTSQLGIGDNATQDQAYDAVEASILKISAASSALESAVDAWLASGDGGAVVSTLDPRCGTVRPGEWCNPNLAPTLVWRVAQSTETDFNGQGSTICSSLGEGFRFPERGELLGAIRSLIGNPALARLSSRVHYGPDTTAMRLANNAISDLTGVPQSVVCAREVRVPRESLPTVPAAEVCGTVHVGEFCDGAIAPTLVFRTLQSHETSFESAWIDKCADLGAGYRYPTSTELTPVVRALVTSPDVAKLTNRVHYLTPGNPGARGVLILQSDNSTRLSTDYYEQQSFVCVRNPE